MMYNNNPICLVDNEFFYTAEKEINRKKVILTVWWTKLKMSCTIIIVMLLEGKCSGVNATLFTKSLSLEWCIKENIEEYIKSCPRCQLFNKIKTLALELIPIKADNCNALDLVGVYCM